MIHAHCFRSKTCSDMVIVHIDLIGVNSTRVEKCDVGFDSLKKKKYIYTTLL